jgi:hypothetical protein
MGINSHNYSIKVRHTIISLLYGKKDIHGQTNMVRHNIFMNEHI